VTKLAGGEVADSSVVELLREEPVVVAAVVPIEPVTPPAEPLIVTPPTPVIVVPVAEPEPAPVSLEPEPASPVTVELEEEQGDRLMTNRLHTGRGGAMP